MGVPFGEVLWLQQREGEIGTPVPPSCRHRGTPELSSAVEGEIGTTRTRELSSARCTPELSSVQGHDCRVRRRQGARSQWLRFKKAFFVLGFILDRVELAENQEAIAACVLCKKGAREQFVARSNGSEYVCCSNWGVAIFAPSRICPVTSTWCSWTWLGGAVVSAPSTLDIAGVGRPYFVCRDRWSCTFLCWADLEVTMCPLTEQQQ